MSKDEGKLIDRGLSSFAGVENFLIGAGEATGWRFVPLNLVKGSV
ncbi:MAG: hypothetical protein ABFD46_09530 [Armatimonadota bacterium]